MIDFIYTDNTKRKSIATGEYSAKIFSQSLSIFSSNEFILFSEFAISEAKSLSNSKKDFSL